MALSAPTEKTEDNSTGNHTLTSSPCHYFSSFVQKRAKRVHTVPQRPRAEDVVTAEDFFPLVEGFILFHSHIPTTLVGSNFLKVCRSGKTHRTRVVLTYDRRYLQWIPDRFSLKSPKSCLSQFLSIFYSSTP